ncbi:MAG TPA: BON domain-containing protein [Steroidobacteraceae bacterium]|nr:BON domain-containing protein [Steroidobacteraceae bacterium]
MNSQNSRKIIVASGMTVVIGILAVIFTLRSHHDTLVAQANPPATPFAEAPAAPAAVAPTPDATAAVAQTPEAPAAVAQVPEAPAAVAHNKSTGTKGADTATASAVEPKLARSQHLAKADTSASSADPVKRDNAWTTAPAISSSPADAQKMPPSMVLAASDSQITTDVKSQLAGDSLSKDVNIGVTTTDGVVALTGTLASQIAIAHVKDVAAKVKDVKSVDTSALVLASL